MVSKEVTNKIKEIRPNTFWQNSPSVMSLGLLFDHVFTERM